jgi:DNA adenine methylase
MKVGSLRSPVIWFGGKGNMVAKLLKFIPLHRIYVEVFGGGASLLFAKEPSPVEVYNDIDSGLVNFFRVLRDKDKFQEFYRKVCLTPYSREEFYYCRDTWKDCEDEVERAYRWFIVARMSFSGDFGYSWGFNVSASARGMAKKCSAWLSTIEELPAIHERIIRVQIEHKDFRDLIKTYDTEDTFFYLDPPYVPETRKDGGYKHEMTDNDHEDLVEILLNIKGKAMLSGYTNRIYKKLENAGWIRHDFETTCHAAGRTRQTGILGKGAAKEKCKRIESIWLSPNCLDEHKIFS